MSKNLNAVKKATEQLAKAQGALRAERGRRMILCSCGKRHQICKLVRVVTHWYVEPHGCTGGDYWREGEWAFICPKTQVRNRLLFDDYDVEWDKMETEGAEGEFKRIYDRCFAKSMDVYERSDGLSVNNYYVDRNRERFELPPKRDQRKR